MSLIGVVDDKFFVLVVGIFDGLIKFAFVSVAVVENARGDGRNVMNAHGHELRNHRGFAGSVRAEEGINFIRHVNSSLTLLFGNDADSVFVLVDFSGATRTTFILGAVGQ